MSDRNPLDSAYWQDAPGERKTITYRSSAYVPAQVEVLPPVKSKAVQLPEMNVPHLVSDTTAVDRAQAFVIETNRLSVIVGGLAVLVAWLGLGHPLWTTGMLLVFFMWYSLVWLAVWLVHRFLTPEALAWFHAVMVWRHLRK